MWTELTWEAWLTLATLIVVVFLLFSDRVSADVGTVGGLSFLIVTGTTEIDDALSGFSNRGVITIGLLFAISSVLRANGGLVPILNHLLVRTSSLRYGLVRMMVPTTVISAFLNNTPVVALLIQPVRRWADENGFQETKVLIPLSYAAIMGGACTLIGTSTNLVVNGLLEEADRTTLGFFDVGAIGLPIAVLGTIYLLTIGPRLLPAAGRETGVFRDPATFTTEVLVRSEGRLDGVRLRDAEVADFHGLYPIQIQRSGSVIPVPPPDFVLEGGDRLILAGAAASLLAMRRADDLQIARERKFDLAHELAYPEVVEVVLSDHCPLIGDSVGDGTFRVHYGAAVISVSRRGERVPTARVGDWKLRVGDRLLLETGPGFEQHKDSRDFYVVTERADLQEGEEVPKSTQWASLAIVMAMVLVAAAGWTSILVAVAAAAILLVVINRVPGSEMRDAIDWQVILTIGAAFGIAAAVDSTGLADALAGSLISMGAGNVWLSLAAVYFTTFLLTEVITNNAAAALSFPIALAVADSHQASPLPFAIAVMIAASASFMTPLGYQTNLMVYGAGDYRARDFVKVGAPLAAISAAVGIFLTPFVFPF